MADNVSVAGSTIAADEVTINSTSVKAQRIKPGFGVDGTWTEVSSSDPLPVADNVRATGGASMHHKVSAATTNATSVKTSAGTVYGITGFTIDATPVYLKLYDKASAPTVGTDTPVLVLSFQQSTSAIPASYQFPKGLVFSTGIAYAIVTGITDADSTAVAASEVVINIQYN